MAIFQKAYQGYFGEITSINHRTLVICRYGIEQAFKIKWFLPFLMLCFIPPLIFLCVIYLRYNVEVLEKLPIPAEMIPVITASHFAEWMQTPQLIAVFWMVLSVGPAIISPDMRNNALPLYFSRPISKTHYLLGKLLVLFTLCSLISWIPGLLLVLFQSFIADDGWFFSNWGTLVGALLVPLIWITCLSMLSFAVTALVKVKLVARLSFFGIFFVGFMFSNAMFGIFRSWVGGYFYPYIPMDTIVKWLYQADAYELRFNMPLGVSLLTIASITLVSTYIVYRRIRAYEVVA